jgi:predicted Zn-dependent peptidase
MTAVDRSRLPDVGPDPSFTFPTIVHHTFGNGLRVRALAHTSVPVITFVLQIAGGSGADGAGREGLAATLADMVDEGTGSLSAIEVSDAMARIGAEYDVDVAADATTFTLTTLTRFADRGAALLGSLITAPSLRDSDFDRVRQLRLDRLRQLKDLPPAVAERSFLQLLYGNHPYGHLAIGTEASVQQLTLADVVRMHDAWYRPSQTTLVVTGAMSPDELIEVANRAFGGWAPEPVSPSGATLKGRPYDDPGRPNTVDRPYDDPAGTEVASFTRGPRLAIVPRDGAAQSELRIGHISARRDTPDYPALLVMNALLGGQFVSRVNLKLREEKGYTYGARTGFDWHKGASPFTLQASVHTAVTADAIRDSLAELEGIRGVRPPTPAELALAKASLTRGYPRNFETAQQVCRAVAQLALYGLPDTYFAEFIPKVNGVTAEQLVDAALRYVDPERITTLIVGDHAAIGESLNALGFGPPEVLPVPV